ncbi:uclacyanin-3-like [Gastrolobium bilobum]|uniref:uclacyanin-3-like n=1 Tax=Gastrolobium bilobum TaxID=150636 RepID=UPI002AB2F91D|nr:uclacyanin-3-like [Gastrolobium bilobum]
MAIGMVLAASFLVMLLASPTVFATDFTVGDTGGWKLGTDYSTWPSGKTFKVGDNLVFNYDSTHGVDIVNSNDYTACSSSNAIKSYQGGSTKIALTTPGNMYFLCPTPGHCAGGMKLSIKVVAASGTSPTSPSGTPPTSPSGTPPTTPSNPSPSSGSGTPATNTTAPSPSGAVTVSSGISYLMGSFFVSAIIFGFMG